MKRVVLNYLVIAAFALSAAFTSCGGSGSSGKNLSGTFVGSYYGETVTIIFSGNKIKMVEADGNVQQEGVFELVEEYQEDDFSRGILIITTREDKNEVKYELEGKGKVLIFNRMDFIKEDVSYSKEHLSGTYVHIIYNEESIIFSGNNIKWIYRETINHEGAYKLLVLESKKEGFSRGILNLIDENSGKIYNYRYLLEENKLTLFSREYLLQQ